MDPETMGMARSGIALVRGLGSIAANPGALDLETLQSTTLDHSLTASLYTFGGTLGSTYLSSTEFQDLFGKRPSGLTNEQRQRVGDLLEDERLFANGGVTLLQARYRTPDAGTFGFHYGHRLFARVNVPDSFALLVRTGNIAGSYRFVNRGVGATWATQFGLSYGLHVGSETRPGWIPSAGLGLTLKLLLGVAHFDVEGSSALSIMPVEVGGSAGFLVQGGYRFRSAQPENFDQASAVSQFRTALFPGTSGTGFGADLGVSGVLYRTRTEPAGTLRDAVFYGVVLQDVGSINWSSGTYERTLLNVRDTLRTANLTNEQFRRFEGTLEPSGEFSTSLPTVLRAGLGFDIGAMTGDASMRLVAGIEAEAPLDDEPGNAEVPRLAIGAAWGADEWLTLRAGLSFGGVSEFGAGLGVGLRPLDWLTLDVGSSEVTALFSGHRIDASVRLTAGLDALLGDASPRVRD